MIGGQLVNVDIWRENGQGSPGEKAIYCMSHKYPGHTFYAWLIIVRCVIWKAVENGTSILSVLNRTVGNNPRLHTGACVGKTALFF